MSSTHPSKHIDIPLINTDSTKEIDNFFTNERTTLDSKFRMSRDTRMEKLDKNEYSKYIVNQCKIEAAEYAECTKDKVLTIFKCNEVWEKFKKCTNEAGDKHTFNMFRDNKRQAEFERMIDRERKNLAEKNVPK